jgi:hypothetical protein
MPAISLHRLDILTIRATIFGERIAWVMLGHYDKRASSSEPLCTAVIRRII